MEHSTEETRELAISVANMVSRHRGLVQALERSDADGDSELLAWSRGVTEVVASVAEHVGCLLEDDAGAPDSH